MKVSKADRMYFYREIYDALQFVFNQCPSENRKGHFEFEEFAKSCSEDSGKTVTTVYLVAIWLLLIFEGNIRVFDTLEGEDGNLGELEIGFEDLDENKSSNEIIKRAQQLTSSERLDLIHKAAMLYRK